MTSNTIGEVEMAEDTEDPGVADAAEASDETTKPAGGSGDTPRAVEHGVRPERSRNPWRWLSAVLLVALIAVGAFGYVKFNGVNHELAASRQADADRATATQLAKDYALKSLTYSFEDPDAFFRSVEEGVSDALKDKYVNATDLLKGIMLQAQVTSSGEVLATDAIVQPGGVYQVVVSASQTTRNLQNPDPRVSTILLQITVNKVGDTWQISDIGPKTGSQAANADQIPPVEPAPGPTAPAPAPKR